ncbi:MAG: FAD-dependent oxidoreductase [Chitinophagaceae bacterium]
MYFIRKIMVLFICVSCLLNSSFAQQVTTVDICVYGGSSAGVIAAYTARKMGKSVILVEPGQHLGGLSSGGLGYTDIGNKYAISGLALDFYRRIGQHYGKFEQWIFEPHVAEQTFKGYIQRGAVDVLYTARLKSVEKQGPGIVSVTVENSKKPEDITNRVIRAKMFIDCSYEGDLMAKAGVSYTTGRESNAVYNETFNGVQIKGKHQFPDGIDPYKTKGDAASGLLWGISAVPPQPRGSGDKKLQAYNFRICLSSDPANQIAITRPEEYDPAKYELLIRVLEKDPKRPFNLVLKPDLMPNQKTDINNNGPLSTDMIGMNYEYAEGDYAKREAIQKSHELYIKGLLYFIGHDERVPVHLRTEMMRWGYPKDEYADNGNWSPQMYVREARRMTGAYVMTQANCQGKEVITDGVGMAAYTMDSHNCDRVVITENGVAMVKNEGDVQEGGFPPYPISYRCIVPKENECNNLLVPVCLSASHIAYGSIRMEPVFMVLGQSAAVAASMSIDQKNSLLNVDMAKLQHTLAANPLADGSSGDIFIDNEKKGSVILTGNWKTIKDARNSYGPSWLQADTGGGFKTARFVPEIRSAGKYGVYTYVPKITGASATVAFNVYDGRVNKEGILDHAKVVVEGQTSGEWVSLGTYNFPAGKKGFVEITNKNANGIVLADAFLFIPEKR